MVGAALSRSLRALVPPRKADCLYLVSQRHLGILSSFFLFLASTYNSSNIFILINEIFVIVILICFYFLLSAYILFSSSLALPPVE